MADFSALGSGRQRSARVRLSWLRDHAAAILATLLAAAAIVTAIVVGPGIRATGPLTEVGALDLGTAAAAGHVQARGQVQRGPYGYEVQPGGTARVTVTLPLPSRAHAQTLLRLWLNGNSRVQTRAALIGADGRKRSLGAVGLWTGRTFDVTQLARAGGTAKLRVTSINHVNAPVPFVDRVAPVVAPDTGAVTASTWSVALLVALVAAAFLAVFSRLGRHWPLPLALAAFAALVWHRIPGLSLTQLPPPSGTVWNDATAATWFGFHNGLLWGSWTYASSLAVQLFHAFIPIVGNATVSARSAALLAALLTLAVVYALGYRAAGRIGGVVAVLIGLAAAPLRDAAVAGSATPVLVLAAALALYGLHTCLAKATTTAIALLAAGLSLVVLAEPLWLPGAIAAVAVVALICGERGRRWQTLGAGALVALVLVGPHLTSAAAQNNGSPFVDVNTRVLAARNTEFAGGEHGAPSPATLRANPTVTGQPVSLQDYVFGDHSLAQVLGGTLTGGQRALSAFSGGGSVPGTIAFVLALIGVAYALIVPRLRLMVLVPLIVALPTLFLAGRIRTDDFTAGSVWWPVLPVGAAILAYAAAGLARPVLEPRMTAVRTRIGSRKRRERHRADTELPAEVKAH